MTDCEAGNKYVPNLRDILQKQLEERNTGKGFVEEYPDIEFEYADTDSHTNEIAEIYTYKETTEMEVNVEAFNDLNGDSSWQKLSTDQQKDFLMQILNLLESSQSLIRLKAMRCILYLVQGCWAEEQSTDEQTNYWTRSNVFLLYELEAFPLLIQFLSYGIDPSESRVILITLNIIVEVMREEQGRINSKYQDLVMEFVSELNENTDNLLTVKLFDMVTAFCNGLYPDLPIKLVVLLLWKLILMSLGGMDTLRDLKRQARARYGLESQTEPGLELTKNMLGETTGSTPATFGTTVSEDKKFPWKPKVCQKEIDLILNRSRQKFFGYTLENDSETLAGLPLPIQEGIKTMRSHIYTSVSEIQVRKEAEIACNPMSTCEGDIEQTPTEILYHAMLPNLPQYMIAMLKLLFAANSVSKFYSGTINILKDVIPETHPETTVETMKLAIDINRHKEVIIKAVSGILILLLKHFKLNHVYQFEFMSQNLVYANCIPLFLRFFNRNLQEFVTRKNSIPILDFPGGEYPDLKAEDLDDTASSYYSWRNMFSCINLLRILNKITKRKDPRIMMMVRVKSALILKRTLSVRHPILEYYALKLLKMQTKYLGRQWRKSNMNIISAIYAKVRHGLTDEWAFENELELPSWNIQVEECGLRACVHRFNNRRYLLDTESEQVDNNLYSVLNREVKLSEDFCKNYELWLEQEVYNTQHDWDRLIVKTPLKKF